MVAQSANQPYIVTSNTRVVVRGNFMENINKHIHFVSPARAEPATPRPPWLRREEQVAPTLQIIRT